MVRETDIPVDSLNRPEGNSLQENYESHDCGEAFCKSIIKSHNLFVEDWGINQRHRDDTLVFDNKMDFRVWESAEMEELLCLIDVKTKNTKAWERRFNKRHYDKYYEHVEEYDVPVYVAFCILEGSEVAESSLFPMHHYDREDGYSCTFTFPDGNEGVYIPVDHVSGWELFRGECL